MPFPFSSGDVLTAADLNSIGQFVSFTPNFATGLTVGNGTSIADYALVGEKMCFIRIRFTLGSTSAVTGQVRIAYPFTVDDSFIGGLGECNFEDNSGNEVFGRVFRYSSTQFHICWDKVSGNKIIPDFLSSSQPFTWTTNDKISVKLLVKLQ
tara:strand:+ start:8984 stop:9439 length:456 start_codon:yes stop_codon:yes gene_type:complete